MKRFALGLLVLSLLISPALCANPETTEQTAQEKHEQNNIIAGLIYWPIAIGLSLFGPRVELSMTIDYAGWNRHIQGKKEQIIDTGAPEPRDRELFKQYNIPEIVEQHVQVTQSNINFRYVGWAMVGLGISGMLLKRYLKHKETKTTSSPDQPTTARHSQ